MESFLPIDKRGRGWGRYWNILYPLTKKMGKGELGLKSIKDLIEWEKVEPLMNFVVVFIKIINDEIIQLTSKICSQLDDVPYVPFFI